MPPPPHSLLNTSNRWDSRLHSRSDTAASDSQRNTSTHSLTQLTHTHAHTLCTAASPLTHIQSSLSFLHAIPPSSDCDKVTHSSHTAALTHSHTAAHSVREWSGLSHCLTHVNVLCCIVLSSPHSAASLPDRPAVPSLSLSHYLRHSSCCRFPLFVVRLSAARAAHIQLRCPLPLHPATRSLSRPPALLHCTADSVNSTQPTNCKRGW